MAAVSDIRKISKLLERSFDQQPWYGPSVLETLEGITESQANLKRQNLHSILELVRHMIAWRRFVTQQLLSQPIEVTEEENFPVGGSWPQALKDLRESQTKLLEALGKFPEDRLNDIVPTREYRFHTMLHGIIQHDIYHTGQIALLKKLSD